MTRLHESDEKIALPIQSNRTYLGDNYHYYISGKRFFNRNLNNIMHPGGEHSNIEINPIGYVYAGALFTSGLIDYIAEQIFYTSRDAVLFSLIFQGALIIFIFMLSTYIILGEKQNLHWFSQIIFCFLSIYFMNWFILATYYGTFRVNIQAPYPEIFRIVNPQMGWVAGLLLLCSIHKMLNNSRINFYISTILALIISTFSISLTCTLIAGLSLYIMIDKYQTKKIDFRCVTILGALVASFLFSRYNLAIFHLTKTGEELQTGNFVSLKIHYHFLKYLLFSIPLVYIFKDYKSKNFLISVFIASILVGAICDSFELGSRMWIRGSVIYVALFSLIFIIALFNKASEKFYRLIARMNNGKLIILGSKCIVGLFIGYLIIMVPQKPRGYYGFIEKEKWDAINWLNHHVKFSEIVLSANLEDSFLIPIYTKGKPFVSLYGTSSDVTEIIVEKYVMALKYFNNLQEYIRLISEYTPDHYLNLIKFVSDKTGARYPYKEYQISAFYSMLLYYPYNKNFANVFTLESEKNKLQMWMENLQNKAINYPYHYILIDKRYDTLISNPNEDICYENKFFLVKKLRRPNTTRGII